MSGAVPVLGAATLLADDRQHVTDGSLEALLENARQTLALQRILHLGLVDHDVAGQSPLTPQIVPGVLVGREKIAGIELQALREGQGKAVRGLDGGSDRLGLLRIELRVAPDRLAVLAPVAAERPARQLFAGIPLALAEMQKRSRCETVR